MEAIFPDNELDSSWLLALHWARLHRLDFGHEFVLTYGPWGFILRGYNPQTFGLVVLGWTFYTTVFFAALVQLASDSRLMRGSSRSGWRS